MRTNILFLVFLLLINDAQAKTSLAVTFAHDGMQLNGRLQLPDGNGPFQVIIVDPGSGANDKDGTLPMNDPCLYPGLTGDTLRPYKGLSDALSDSGYAVFTYDKLEYTYSNPGVITFHKLWLPVESAINYLKTRTDIDLNNMVILGHSEGSSIAPYIARTQPSVKALISLAGPRTPLDTILAYQLLNIARTCNGDTIMAKSQGDQVLQYCSAIRTGNWNSSTPALFGVPANVWVNYLHVVDSVSINYNIAARPTLFIGLGNDINVPISTELNRFQKEITIPADFYTVPNVNHYLVTPTDPATSQVVTDTIVYWLRKHLYPTAINNISRNPDAFSIAVENRHINVIALQGLVNRVVITDMAGRVVYQNNTPEVKKELSLNDIAPGIYILTANSNNAYKTVRISIQ